MATFGRDRYGIEYLNISDNSFINMLAKVVYDGLHGEVKERGKKDRLDPLNKALRDGSSKTETKLPFRIL